MPRELLTQQMLDEVTEAPEGYALEKLDKSADPEVKITLIISKGKRRYYLLPRTPERGRVINSFFAMSETGSLSKILDDLQIVGHQLVIR